MTSPQKLKENRALIRTLGQGFPIQQKKNSPEPVQQIAISLTEGIYMIDVDDIAYLKAEGNYCKISSKSKTHLVSKTLKQISEKIKSGDFIRVHQSYLINSACIAFYNKQESSIQLKSDELIPVSRSGRKVLLQWFERFLV